MGHIVLQFKLATYRKVRRHGSATVVIPGAGLTGTPGEREPPQRAGKRARTPAERPTINDLWRW